MKLPVVMVGSLPIVRFDRAQWAAYLLEEVQIRRRLLQEGTASGRSAAIPLFFTSANGHVLSRAAADPAFRALLAEADGIDADGMPLVLASRVLSDQALPERCATTDFFHDFAGLAEQHGVSFYLLGGEEAVNAAAVDAVQQRYPRLRIAGRHHGYFRRAEERRLVDEINRAAPDMLWIGLGVPKEHEFVSRNRALLRQVCLIKSCGGLFDFLCGARSRAPAAMQRTGCEWLYRLVLEPRRLLRRYARTNIHAVWLLLTGTVTPLTSSQDKAAFRGRISCLDEDILSL
ncbi:WecB/TagA/CpsF family glycosyltransferase [Rhodoligotrophos defluvii]|uniref:WecB/TagA/CpsF family glycosyltransferase n=1 Tax=Rhodoligotrophos defluvii TaxID=2561934 RepID=UPI0010C96390|nr:WecB/TagA/CpsF family glycosyltransferase [Rhodoligotrophos defluvii]